MIPYSLLSQVSLIVVAVALTFTFIKPSLVEISTIQDKTAIYQSEIEKVAEVNQKLAALVAKTEAVSVEDHKRLLTYMPDAVDAVSVQRDMKAIADLAGVSVNKIKYVGPMAGAEAEVLFNEEGEVISETVGNDPEPHSFEFDIEGSYDQIKSVVSSLEQNHYPLEVSELAIKKMEGGFLSAAIKITAYDSVPPPAIVPEF